MKYFRALKQLKKQLVRPLAGAGIEIWKYLPQRALPAVRPLAGAGIEIVTSGKTITLRSFAPSRGRELKSFPFA